MSKVLRKVLGGTTALALALSLALPVWAADPQVTIYAGEHRAVQELLEMDLYQRDGQDVFQFVEGMELVTPVNRVTKDMEFQLTPAGKQTALTVNYLTDLDGDGVYELLSGEEEPVGDAMGADGALTPGGTSEALTAGATYRITGETLLQRGTAAMERRSTPGSGTYLSQVTASSFRPEDTVYMITVSDLAGDEELCYYFRLYDALPTTAGIRDYIDVPVTAWYAGAVDYVLSEGLLSGTSDSRFSPYATLSRGMLAQILYNLAGRPETGDSSFQDVPRDAWYYQAVTWAVEEGILSGTSETTFLPNQVCSREQTALVLRQFAKYMGVDVSARADLDRFADDQSVSPWAREAVEWAVASGLLAGSGGTSPSLNPGDGLNRAEFSTMLRTLCQSVLP